MKIAIFCQQLEYMGGIERVVLEQLRIFSEHGAQVELLMDRPPVLMKERITCKCTVLAQSADERERQLTKYLQENSPDLLIFHGVSHQFGKQDAEVATRCGTKNVCVIHFPFVSNIALGGGEYNSWKQFRENGEACTAFATVSEIDAHFWRALGKKSFHVQNPFVHPPKNAEMSRRTGEDGVANLLWVGRLCEQKQPKTALAAFARAVARCPGLTLTMVGGHAGGIGEYRKVAERLGVAEKVEFVSERPDISEYWAKADIHLLTSICESFCLVWAEAKAAGLPTVMFELPYLELAHDPRGYVAVEQRTVEALAGAIVDLAQNAKNRLEMGREAKESLKPFTDEAVWDSWMRLYEGLMDDKAGIEEDPNLRTIVTQLYAAASHDKEVHRWPEEMAEDFTRLTRCSMRPLAKAMRTLAELGRKIKGVIRE